MQLVFDQTPIISIQKFTSATNKLVSIELLRVVSMIGVIWFHIEEAPYKFIGHAGLVAFVMICATFQSMAAENETLKSYLLRRGYRIAPPWLAWFAIYALLNLMLDKKQFPWSEGIIANILTGPWIGLWFLPFVWIVSPVVFILTRSANQTTVDQSIPILLCIAGILLTTTSWILKITPPPQPWCQWLHASAAIPLAIALRQSVNVVITNNRFRLSVVLSVWVVICISLLGINTTVAVTYAIGAMAVALAFNSKLQIPKFISNAGNLCLGVYLIHPIIIGLLKMIPIFNHTPLMMLVGTTTLSFGVVHQLRNVPAFCKIV